MTGRAGRLVKVRPPFPVFLLLLVLTTGLLGFFWLHLFVLGRAFPEWLLYATFCTSLVSMHLVRDARRETERGRKIYMRKMYALLALTFLVGVLIRLMSLPDPFSELAFLALIVLYVITVLVWGLLSVEADAEVSAELVGAAGERHDS